MITVQSILSEIAVFSELIFVASLSRSNPSFGHANLLNQHQDVGP